MVVCSRSRKARILVCGGAAVDNIVKPYDTSQSGASHTSLPGSLAVSHGGVGRNIAEGIANLGGAPCLLSAVGDDGAGEQLLAGSARRGIEVSNVARLHVCRTATFTALLDGLGELVGAVADMAVFDEIHPEIVNKASEEFANADLVICDANLPMDTVEHVLRCSTAASVPAWFEPVSCGKALRGRCSRPWHLMTPNWDELLTMLDLAPSPIPKIGDFSRLPDAVMDVLGGSAIATLADNVLVTMGPRGAVLASGPHVSRPDLMASGVYDLPMQPLLEGIDGAPIDIPNLTLAVEFVEGAQSGPIWYRLLRPLAVVRDCTGAGDALVAGMACAYAGGWPLEQAVLAGLLCSHLTLFVDGAVAHFFDHRLLNRLRQAAQLTTVAEVSRL